MSIYATLWILKFPKLGEWYPGCQWIEVTAQAVPPHIGSPTPGQGYESADPCAEFLPPALATDEDGEADRWRSSSTALDWSADRPAAGVYPLIRRGSSAMRAASLDSEPSWKFASAVWMVSLKGRVHRSSRPPGPKNAPSMDPAVAP